MNKQQQYNNHNLNINLENLKNTINNALVPMHIQPSNIKNFIYNSKEIKNTIILELPYFDSEPKFEFKNNRLDSFLTIIRKYSKKWYTDILSRNFNLIIKFRKVHLPYMDPIILSKNLAHIISTNPRNWVKKYITENIVKSDKIFINRAESYKIFLNKEFGSMSSLPSYIKGIKIVIRGKEKNQPKTSKYVLINGLLDKSGHTLYNQYQIHNKLGYYSVKVWLHTT